MPRSFQFFLLSILFLTAAVVLSGCMDVAVPAPPPIDLTQLTPDQIRSLQSLEKIDDYPLYKMDYYGDYAGYLKENILKVLNIQKPAKSSSTMRGCTTFAALAKDGEPILGRNHDFFEHPILLLFTHPKKGYSSVSLVDLFTLGFNNRKDTLFTTEKEKALLLYAPYMLSDGMNERGLTVGEMYVPEACYPFSTEDETTINLEIGRLLLDNTATVDEALEYLHQHLETHNLIFPVMPIHYLIADASGHSAVLEFYRGKMRVIRNTEPWQAAANFTVYNAEDLIKKGDDEYLRSGKISGDFNGRTLLRYVTAYESLKAAGGRITDKKALDICEAVSCEANGTDVWMSTIWSVVYNMKTGNITLALDKKYNSQKLFQLSLAK
jgi:hypothetical protein